RGSVTRGATHIGGQDRVAALHEVLKESVEIGPGLALRSAVWVDDDRRQLACLYRRTIKPRGNHPAVERAVPDQLRLAELRERDPRTAGMGQLPQRRSALAPQACQIPDPDVHIVTRP